MTTTAIFDTLAFAKRMKEAGFTEKQAEEQAEAFAEIIDNKVATKQDIENLRLQMDAKLEIITSKLDWLIKLVSLVGIIIAILAYFKH